MPIVKRNQAAISGVLLLLLCIAPTSVWALPFDVESASQLKAGVRSRGLEPLIEGRLVDNVHQGIANASVQVVVRTPSSEIVDTHTINTDYLGYIHERLTLQPGEYVVDLLYRPDNGHRPSQVSLPFEVIQETIGLEIENPELVHVQQNGVFRVQFTTQTRWTPEKPVTVEASVGSGDRVYRRTVTLGVRAALPVSSVFGGEDRPTELVGFLDVPQGMVPRGALDIDVYFLGDNRFAAAEAHSETFVFQGPRMKFTAEVIQERDRRGISVYGELLSDQGPLTGARIQAEAASGNASFEAVGDLYTEGDGRFSGFVPADRVPPGEVRLRMSFIPDAGPALRSKPVILDVDPSSATGWAMWLLVVLFLVVVGVLFLWFVWEQLSTWWALKKRRSVQTWSGQGSVQTIDAIPANTSKALDAISGFVFTEDTDQPVAGATVLALQGGLPLDSPIQTATDERGFFALHDLPRGRLQIRVAAHGYMTADVDISIPHAGKFRCFKLELLPVRERVRELYEWLLEQASPDEELWGWNTPREVNLAVVGELGALMDRIEDDITSLLVVRAREALESGTGNVAELLEIATRLLEEVYYSATLYPESTARLAEQLVQRLEPLLFRGTLRRRRFSRRKAEKTRDSVFGTPPRVGQ